MTTPVAARPSRVAWLVLIYRLPAGSGLKAVIRRKLTALGATYPVNAVAVLPASPTVDRSRFDLDPAPVQACGSCRRRILSATSHPRPS